MACQITNNSNLDTSGFEDTIQQLVSFSQDRFGFEKPPALFLNSDPSNASDPLGKTAYYDPENKEIHIYVDERHPKDIMRSISHELIHHVQNLRGDLSGNHYHGEGYAQKDEHMREMEREAYEQGNLCFRDFEDKLKLDKTTYNEWRTNKMSLKEWKNKELFGLLANKWGFGKNIITEAQDADGDDSDPKVGAKLEEADVDPLDLVVDEIKWMLENNPDTLKDFLMRSCSHLGENVTKHISEGLDTILEDLGMGIQAAAEDNPEASLAAIDQLAEEDAEDEDYRHKESAMDDFSHIAKLHKDLVYDTYKKHEDDLLGHEDAGDRHDDAEYDDATHIADLKKDAHYDADHDKLQEMIGKIVKEILNDRQ